MTYQPHPSGYEQGRKDGRAEVLDGELPRHKFWGAGEPDCPPELKATNGELHTVRCKVCGDGWRKSRDVCLVAAGVKAHVMPVNDLSVADPQPTAGVQEFCRFPDCKCPMDPGPEPWCAIGLPQPRNDSSLSEADEPK